MRYFGYFSRSGNLLIYDHEIESPCIAFRIGEVDAKDSYEANKKLIAIMKERFENLKNPNKRQI